MSPHFCRVESVRRFHSIPGRIRRPCSSTKSASSSSAWNRRMAERLGRPFSIQTTIKSNSTALLIRLANFYHARAPLFEVFSPSKEIIMAQAPSCNAKLRLAPFLARNGTRNSSLPPPRSPLLDALFLQSLYFLNH